jgi:hypothetical protein
VCLLARPEQCSQRGNRRGLPLSTSVRLDRKHSATVTLTVALTEVTAETRQDIALSRTSLRTRLHGMPSSHRSRHAGQIIVSKTCRRQSRENQRHVGMLNLVFLGPHVQITGGDDACEGSQRPFGSWPPNRELATFQPAYLSLAAAISTAGGSP